ncbi:glycine-rich domain-containing protein [Piscinibacter terrae]|uniref:Uncharacterized protein n=1 Tax=Piscinibacter terrae TaxID=2496871 RepID=A0A3N7JZ53_9BURK|nr:hypothetical protein [Albitalea terrae]RQP26059.1 hypothetical protein DZC73_03160 [Albitalea terrae]
MNASLGRQVLVFIPLLVIALVLAVVSGASPKLIPIICVGGLVALAGFNIYGVWWRSKRRRMVLDHPFPSFLRKKLRAQYPTLTERQVDDVERGLRQFFVANAQSGGRFVAMPSKVVDALWHEFILHTRGYQDFCKRVFGRMLHHTPTEAMPPESLRRGDNFSGLRRAWYWSCKDEGINPRKPNKLPLLFALDTMLAIPGGYKYVPDCTLLGADRGDTHCAVGFACGSSCGSSSGTSDAGVSCGSGDGGDGGGGDGGGDGGGCGGGCGGGGD